MFPSLPDEGEYSDFQLIGAEEPDVIAQTVIDLVQTCLPWKFNVDPVRGSQKKALAMAVKGGSRSSGAGRN